MKAYITKYWATKGIFEVEAETTRFDGMISVKKRTSELRETFHKPYWHETMAAAIEHAESLRLKKIKALEKQIANVKNLRFSPPNCPK